MKKNNLLILILLIGCFVPLFNSATATLYSIADAEIYAWNPTSNFGSNLTMTVYPYSTLWNKRAVVKFNLGSYTNISAATLKLYASTWFGQARSIYAKRITADWAENTVTWNNIATSTTTSGQEDVTCSALGWCSWNVTTIVKAWDTGTANYGFMMISNPEDASQIYITFHTKENSNDPELEITYTAASDTTPPTFSSFSITDTSGYTSNATPTLTLSASDAVGVTEMAFSCNNSTWSSWITYATSYSSFNITTGAGCTTAQGSKTVYAKVRDAAGNVSTVRNDSTVYDTVNPTASSISISGGASYTNDATPDLTLSASDATSGVKEMRFSCDNSNWSAWVAYATSYSSFNITTGAGCTTSQGTKTVYFRVRDNANRISTAISDSIIYDTVNPTASSISISGGASYTNDSTPDLTLSASDATSGVYQMSFSCDNSNWSSWVSYTTSYSSFNMTTGTTGCTTTQGTKAIYFKVKDTAGNDSSSVSDIIGYDSDVPTISSFAIEGGAETTYSSTPTLSLSASDSLSGVYQMRFSCDDSTWSDWVSFNIAYSSFDLTSGAGCSPGYGEKTIYVQVSDNANNLSVSSSDSILYPAPNAAPNLTVIFPSNEFFSGDVNVVFDVNDDSVGDLFLDLYLSSSALEFEVPLELDLNLSTTYCYDADLTDITRCEYSLNTLGITDGNYFLDFNISDSSDANYAVSSIEFGIDNNGPFTWFSGYDYSWVSSANISLFCDDGIGIGCDDILYRVNASDYLSYVSPLSFGADGNYFLDFYSTDLLGNVGDVNSVYVAVDSSVPVIGSFVIDANADITYSSVPVLSLSASDVVSGLSEMRFSCDDSSWSDWVDFNESYSGFDFTSGAGCSFGFGGKTVYVQVSDVAGNVASSFDFIVYLSENVAPDLNVVSPLNEFVSGDVNVVFDVVDSSDSLLLDLYVSGVAGSFGSLVVSDLNLFSVGVCDSTDFSVGSRCFYSFDSSLFSDGNYFLDFNVVDSGGLSFSTSSLEFGIDNSGPFSWFSGYNNSWVSSADISLFCDDGVGVGCDNILYMVGGVGVATSGSWVSDVNLIGLWHFDGDVVDSSGSGFDGVVSDVLFGVGLWDSNAGVFDGVYSVVDLGSDWLPSGELTFSAWVKPYSFNDSGFNSILNNGSAEIGLYSGIQGLFYKSKGTSWSESYDSTETRIYSLAVFDNKLYAGTGTGGKVFVFDGSTWSESYDSTEYYIYSLAVFEDKLYAGTDPSGKILVFDGSSWSEFYDSSESYISSLAVFDNKLYAGTYNGGKVLVFDGSTWSESYDSSETFIFSLAVFDNKLYAGTGTGGKVFVFDGSSWSESYDSSETYIYSLGVFDNKLYAGTDPSGKILVFDGSSWSESYGSTETRIYSLAVFNNKLYAGTNPSGKILVFDGSSWSESYDSTEFSIYSLGVFDNKLYAGTIPSGKVLVFDGNELVSSDVDSINLNEWNHIAMSRNANGLTNFYVNGELSGLPDQNSGIPVAGLNNVFLGNDVNGLRGFDGLVEELVVWDRVVSSGEIGSLYSSYVGSDYLSYSSSVSFVDDGNHFLDFYSTDLLGNVGDVNSVFVAVDSSVPVIGSFVIDANVDITYSSVPVLSLSATDATSGVKEMSFSCDNSNWSSWVTYATAYSSFDFTSGAGCSVGYGEKTVYVRVSDNAGNISGSTLDSILYLAPNVAPDLNVVSPLGVFVSGDVNVVFDVVDSSDSLLLDLYVSGVAGSFGSLVVSDLNLFSVGVCDSTDFSVGSRCFYSFDSSLFSDGNYFLDFNVVDSGGLSFSTSSLEFGIDNSGPFSWFSGYDGSWVSSADISLFCDDGIGIGCDDILYRVNGVPSATSGSWISDVNLIGLWHFDNSGVDSSMYNVDYNSQISTLLFSEDGLWESSSKLATDDAFCIPDSYSRFDLSESWTISFWAKLKEIPGAHYSFLGKWGSYGSWIDQKSFLLGVASGTTSLRVMMSTDGVGTSSFSSPAGVFDLNVWKHIVVNKNGVDFNIYVDGTLFNSRSTMPASLFNSVSSFCVGTYELRPENFTGGLDVLGIEEVVVWDRLITDEEISSLYSSYVGSDYLTYSSPISLVEDGNHFLDFYSTDLLGNVGDVNSVFVAVDSSDPVISSFVIDANAETTYSSVPVLSLSASDATSGLSEMRFSCDNSSWSDWVDFNESYSGFDITTGAGCSIGYGEKTIYVEISDFANNTASSSDSILYTISNLTPDLNIILPISDFYSDDINVVFDVSDDSDSLLLDIFISSFEEEFGSLVVSDLNLFSVGVCEDIDFTNGSRCYYSLDSTLFSDGNYFLDFNLVDSGDLNKIKSSQEFAIDNTAPNSLTLIINSNDVSTDNTTLSLALSATDNTTISKMQFSCNNTNWSELENYSTSKSFNLETNTSLGCSTENGTKTVYYRVTDLAENLSEPTNDTIILNKNQPTITITEPNGTNDYAAETYTIEFTPNDTDNEDDLQVICYADVDASGYDETEYCGTITDVNKGITNYFECDTSLWGAGLYYIWCEVNDQLNATNSTAKDYSPGQLEQSLISITLLNSEIDLGGLENLQSTNTELDENGIIIRNIGNVDTNINIEAIDLWITETGTSSYYQYKVSDLELGATGIGTNYSYQNVPISVSNLAISTLNYNESSNEARVDFNITVPGDEIAGNRMSLVTFTAMKS